MVHPTPAQLLHADEGLPPEVARHLDGCEACARLRGLLRPAASAASAGVGELDELPAVDPSHYAVHEELRDGTGGMGRTLRAFDRRLGRTVAIKQPLAERGGALGALLRERLEAEARLTARLEHPAIVTVYEAGRWPDGEPFYAMRLVRGAPLTRLIEQRATLVERLALVAEVIKVGDALAYAHAQGVLHRDVKPGNILVGPYGQTVLIDWGLARERSAPAAEPDAREPPGAPGVTAMGIGTPHYMPPEQAAGGEPDERLDIYALGATLYHVLAGEPPYAGGAAAARDAVLTRRPRALAELAPDAPPALVACVERAMARDADARFASMSELVDELHRFQRGELLRSYRYGVLERVARWAQRHRPLLGVAALALVVVAAVVVQSVRRVVRERDARAQAQARAESAYADSRGQTASLLAQHTATRGDALVAALEAIGGHADGALPRQGLVDALAAGLPTRVVDAHNGGELLVAAVDGDRFVIAGIDRTLRVWRTDGTPLDAIPIPIARTQALRVAGAHVLACGWANEAAWVDVDTRTVTTLRAPSTLHACTIGLDGGPVTAGAHELVRWSASGVEVARLDVEAPVNAVAVDAGGAILATTNRGELWRWRAAGAVHAKAHAGTAFGLLPLDRETALTAGFDGRIVRWDLRGDGAPVATVVYEEPGADLGQLTVLDDDHLAVLAQASLSARVLARAGERYELAWRAPSRVIRDARGRVLAVSETGILEVTAASGATVRVLGEHDPDATTIALAGDRLLTGTKGGAAALWDLAAADALPSHAGEVVALDVAAGARGLVASAGLDGRLVLHGAGGDALVRGAELQRVRWAADAGRVVALDALGVVTVVAVDPPARVVTRFEGTPALDVAIAPDGTMAASAGAHGVTLWRVADGARLALDAPGATAVAFTRDGSLLTGHGGGVVRRWTLAGAPAGQRVLADQATTGIRALEPWGLAGSVVLVALRDRTVALDAATLEPRGAWELELVGAPTAQGWVGARGMNAQLVTAGAAHPLATHAAVITAAAVGADGMVATGDLAGEVELWRAGRIAHIAPAGARAAVTALAFVDTDTLAIADARGEIRLVPFTPARGVAVACARLARIGRAAEVSACGSSAPRR